MRKNTKYFVADFETTGEKQYQLEGKTKVYLFYIECIRKSDMNCLGTSIQQFHNYITNIQNNKIVIYFHNLTFDILFYEYYLNEIGIRYFQDKDTIKGDMDGYVILRDSKKNVYAMQLYINGKVIEFRDSYKLLMSSVDKLPNMRGLKKLKGYDYQKIRTEKTIDDFSEFEIEYVKRDVWKVKDILKELLDDIGDYLTIGASSYAYFKRLYYKKDKYLFNKLFPPIKPRDEVLLRKAYNGGLVILNKQYKGDIITEPVISYDVNSLYPSVMKFRKYPIGDPVCIITKSREKRLSALGYDLQVYCVEVEQMTIKDGHHPYIQEHKNYTFSIKTDIPRTIKNRVFFWTNIDLENIRKYYNIDYNIDYEFSFCFKSKEGIFDEYVDTFYKMKKEAKNPFERKLAKLRLNTLYGKFGTKSERLASRSVWDDGELDFETFENELTQDFYLPVAVFVTSYARDVLIRAIQSERKSFIYADTDSIHCIKKLFKGNIKIDADELGAWKCEGEASKSMFLANKQYIKLINGEYKHTIASLSRENHHLVNFKNMRKGFTIKNGKRMRKKVYGGYLIIETDFTFR